MKKAEAFRKQITAEINCAAKRKLQKIINYLFNCAKRGCGEKTRE